MVPGQLLFYWPDRPHHVVAGSQQPPPCGGCVDDQDPGSLRNWFCFARERMVSGNRVARRIYLAAYRERVKDTGKNDNAYG